MAQNKPALKDISKNELADAYSKLKARTEKTARAAREEGEKLTHDLVTLGSAGGMAYLMGSLTSDIDLADEDAVAEATQLMGVDYDLLGGGVLMGAGLFKVAGKSSDLVRSAGVGVLSQYLGRMAHKMGHESGQE